MYGRGYFGSQWFNGSFALILPANRFPRSTNNKAFIQFYPTWARLLILCGIPGSGKTTVARLVARRLRRAVHLRTNCFMAAIAVSTYSNAESKFVYKALIVAGRQALI